MLLLSSLVLALLPASYAFSFSVETSAVECGTMDLSWTGGTAPFFLTIIPAFDYPTNITLPDSAYRNGQGSYQWTINYPTDVQLVVMMSDATGIGAGGVSNIFQVASGNTGCTLRSTQTDFMFYLNETTVAQCEPVEVYWDATAVSPVRVLGVIPLGQIFEFSSIGEATSMVWNTNIAAGTQFILAAFNDGPFGNGGSSALMSVGQSSNSNCLDESSPSSTPAAPSSTGTGTGSNAPTRTGGGIKTVTAIATAQPTGAAGLSGGAIAGIVAGVVIAVLIAQAAFIWFCCRRQLLALVSHRRQMKGREVKRGGDVDLASQLGDPNDVILDDTHNNSARYEDANLRTARTRSSVGDGYAQSSISPFWDDNRVSQSGYDLGQLDMGPPLFHHTRENSFGSTPDGLESGSIHSPSSPLVGHPSFFPGSSSRTNSNSNSLSNLSKAQLASSFAPTNPDHPPEHGRGLGLDGRQPPMTAPSGGFVREQDAGRLPGAEGQEEDTEHLPPMYDPQWQTQDRAPRP